MKDVFINQEAGTLRANSLVKHTKCSSWGANTLDDPSLFYEN